MVRQDIRTFIRYLWKKHKCKWISCRTWKKYKWKSHSCKYTKLAYCIIFGQSMHAQDCGNKNCFCPFKQMQNSLIGVNWKCIFNNISVFTEWTGELLRHAFIMNGTEKQRNSTVCGSCKFTEYITGNCVSNWYCWYIFYAHIKYNSANTHKLFDKLWGGWQKRFLLTVIVIR